VSSSFGEVLDLDPENTVLYLLLVCLMEGLGAPDPPDDERSRPSVEDKGVLHEFVCETYLTNNNQRLICTRVCSVVILSQRDGA
jgi:hypothetical protein